MYNEKNIFLTVSWLSGLLSAEIFISTGECGVQMPPLTSENSHFLRSGPQEATLVMWYKHHARGDLAWVDCLRCHESGKHYNMCVATPLPSCISMSYHLHLCSTPYSINLAKRDESGVATPLPPYTQKSNKHTDQWGSSFACGFVNI